MLIWKPFSFYPSSQIFITNIDFLSWKIILKYLFGGRKKIISISGLGIHICIISDEFKYIYIFNFSEKYVRKIFDENILDENISTKIFRWKYIDKIYISAKKCSTKIFGRKYISTKYFRWKYFDDIYMTKIFDDSF